MHSNRLQRTMRVSEPNHGLAQFVLARFRSLPAGRATAVCYLSQAQSGAHARQRDLLLEAAAEALAHQEAVGALLVMLSQPQRKRRADCAEESEKLCEAAPAGDQGLGSVLQATAALPDQPAEQLNENIAAEARTRRAYDRLASATDDRDLMSAFLFLASRAAERQAGFETALARATEPLSPIIATVDLQRGRATVD